MHEQIVRFCDAAKPWLRMVLGDRSESLLSLKDIQRCAMTHRCWPKVHARQSSLAGALRPASRCKATSMQRHRTMSEASMDKLNCISMNRSEDSERGWISQVSHKDLRKPTETCVSKAHRQRYKASACSACSIEHAGEALLIRFCSPVPIK
jgi:hypothetical protein